MSSAPFYLVSLVLPIVTAGSISNQPFPFTLPGATPEVMGITATAPELFNAQAVSSQSSTSDSEEPDKDTDATSLLQQTFDTQTVEQLKQNIESKHPIAYYFVAVKLFEQDKEEAVFWYYLGQLRYRYHLAANPNIDPTGDPALFASLSSLLGTTINEYAFGDIWKLAATIDRVLAWDKRHTNGYTAKAKQPEELERVRIGLKELKDKILQDQDQIRQQRTENGLENRP